MLRFDENRRFGIEIEAMGIPVANLVAALQAEGIACVDEGYTHIATTHWKIVRDGSISGPNPFELVSPPLQGRAGLEEVKRVCAIVTRLGGQVNRSCGLHVHHDAPTWGLREMRNIVRLYARNELLLDEAMAPSRRNNTYCKGFRDKIVVGGGYFWNLMEQATTARQYADASGGRYHKVNLECWWRQGTIEFRHHHGTLYATKIVAWIVYTQLLMQTAERPLGVRYLERDLRTYQRGNPLWQLAVDLSLHTNWNEADALVKGAIEHLAKRIGQTRATAQAAA